MKNLFLQSALFAFAIFTLFSCGKENMNELVTAQDPVMELDMTTPYDVQEASERGIKIIALGAAMRGDNVIPPTQSPAEGKAILYVGEEKVVYKFIAFDIKDPISANLHIGFAGTNGPSIARLETKYDADSNILQGEGSINKQELIDATEGGADYFTKFLLNEGIYINISSKAYPAGEIRGQFTR